MTGPQAAAVGAAFAPRPLRRGRRLATAALLYAAVAAPLGLAQPPGTDADRPGAAAPRERAKALERATPGKPAAPFAIEHSVDGRPELGRAVEIAVTVRALAPATDVSVSFSAEGDLALGDAPVLEAASLAQGDVLRGRAIVTPLAPGRSYLTVLAEGDFRGQHQARTVAITVEAAGGVAEAPAEPGATPDGERSERGEQAIRSLPAEERTR